MSKERTRAVTLCRAGTENERVWLSVVGGPRPRLGPCDGPAGGRRLVLVDMEAIGNPPGPSVLKAP